MRTIRIIAVAVAALLTAAACSKDEAHEEAQTTEDHGDMPVGDSTASQDAEAAIAAAMAASPTALEAPAVAASGTSSSTAAPASARAAPSADHAPAH